MEGVRLFRGDEGWVSKGKVELAKSIITFDLDDWGDQREKILTCASSRQPPQPTVSPLDLYTLKLASPL